jgi:hypothetical protein
MPDLAAEVTEFLKGERGQKLNTDELCWLITKTALHNPQWTKATMQQWTVAVAEAIAKNLIVKASDGTLSLKPLTETPKPKQMGLFE